MTIPYIVTFVPDVNAMLLSRLISLPEIMTGQNLSLRIIG